MQDLNPTTRKYPRTTREAFHRADFLEGPYNAKPDTDPDFWVMLACAFAAGFMVCYLSFTA